MPRLLTSRAGSRSAPPPRACGSHPAPCPHTPLRRAASAHVGRGAAGRQSALVRAFSRPTQCSAVGCQQGPASARRPAGGLIQLASSLPPPTKDVQQALVEDSAAEQGLGSILPPVAAGPQLSLHGTGGAHAEQMSCTWLECSREQRREQWAARPASAVGRPAPPALSPLPPPAGTAAAGSPWGSGCGRRRARAPSPRT